MARYGMAINRGCRLNGPVRCRSCDFRAQNRLGLQGNPIQIPLVMDTAA